MLSYFQVWKKTKWILIIEGDKEDVQQNEMQEQNPV